jgi:hypothetical protein
MKKSSIIKLVLVSTVMASCSPKKEESDWSSGESRQKKVYMRSDTSAHYSRSHFGHGMLSYFIFRPYGSYMSGGGYRRMGFYSDAINHSSNVGRSSSKSSFTRGGFGSSSRRVSS